MYTTIETKIKKRSGWIILSRENKNNALNMTMIDEISDALYNFDSNAKVSSIVITGKGDRAFCSGMDLSGNDLFELSALDRHELQRKILGLFRQMIQLSKPTVARVNGVALGGGFGLACSCDIVVAKEEAIFGTPEINVGLFPYIIMAQLIRSTTNPRKLLQMMLLGEKIDAKKAIKLGFVNEIANSDSLDKKVKEVTDELSRKSPAILRLGRRAFYTMREMEYNSALEYLSCMLSLNMQAEDMLEGISAFIQKRHPDWKGK